MINGENNKCVELRKEGQTRPDETATERLLAVAIS
jgi:hypothetical protein